MATQQDRLSSQQGFTLIEMCMVLLVVGLVVAIVAPNLKNLIPEMRIEKDAKRLTSNLDWLRSEARIHSRRYTIELDLDNARWRFVLPAEERVRSEQDPDDHRPEALDWAAFEDGVRLLGAGGTRQGIVRRGTYEIAFDENGFSSDQSVFLGIADDEKLVYTVQLRGLTGKAEVIADEEGREHPLEEVVEVAF